MVNNDDSCWLTIVGVGEDGMAGLCTASRAALEHAEVIMGARRHLALLDTSMLSSTHGSTEYKVWPAPFADGIPQLLALRGRRTVMLASGDPFWFGAGTTLMQHLQAHEWRALPALSVFNLAASRLGWALEKTPCLGLHAAPFTRIRPHLQPGQRLLLLVRDGIAVTELAAWIVQQGFGASKLHILEALGGDRERVRSITAANYSYSDVSHPVTVGLEIAGNGIALPCCSGLPDSFFDHDGQFTKRPVRALTLSALAPQPGELLWDIGAGSGSIAIEWLLSHPDMDAIGFETNATRLQRAKHNAMALGVDRLRMVEGRAPHVLVGQPTPAAVFIGGGLSDELLADLWVRLPAGTRLVANAVTLESETLLTRWQTQKGGSLLRIELADVEPLGKFRAWKSRYPVVQWSVTL